MDKPDNGHYSITVTLYSDDKTKREDWPEHADALRLIYKVNRDVESQHTADIHSTQNSVLLVLIV